MKATIVIPTCRDISFLDSWKDTDLKDHHLIVVEDRFKSELTKPEGWDVEIVTRTDIQKDLKDKSWIIPFGDGGIKSYGLYKAYQANSDLVVCLDDDVHPLTTDQKFVESHYNILSKETHNQKWFNQIIGGHLFPRGFPVDPKQRSMSKIVLNAGLWKDNPDLSAFEFFKPDYNPSEELKYQTGVISHGKLFCLSAMNMAFKPEIIPAFYQGYMGNVPQVYRYDDVWAGMFLKKIADHLGYSVHMGEPMVVHKKKSDERKSLQKEIHGMTLHEQLWPVVEHVELVKDNWKDCYKQLASSVAFMTPPNSYFVKMSEAMQTWGELFE